ncbi:MAG TPA: hypothetical protein VFP55_13065 [Solirubrobacteraceae bacterium]|nr:hypothetical protein [Solirubrobacteraceae bacterium]
MGKRNRQRQRQGAPGQLEKLTIPTSVYRDPEAGELELRGVLSPAARRRYAEVLAGGLNQEDAWQRATELLFELLAVSWTISELRIGRQKELVGRYRMAGAPERRFVRDSLRAHLREHFPEMQAP